MNKAVIGFLAFTVGAGAGVLASQQYFKKKYEQIAQEEINSIKEKYAKKETASEEPVEEYPSPEDFSEEDHEKYESILSENGYTNYSRITDVKDKTYKTTEPYVISPNEFGEDDDYRQISLTFYTDGVLADDNDDPIDDVDDAVGKDSLMHFGEYEPDSVYVRNERLKVDYEILLSEYSHAEIVAKKPQNRRYLDEDEDN